MLKNIYEVEKILDKKLIGPNVYYLVKWKGYSYEEITWEPIENLLSAKSCIRYFEEKLKKENNKKNVINSPCSYQKNSCKNKKTSLDYSNSKLSIPTDPSFLKKKRNSSLEDFPSEPYKSLAVKSPVNIKLNTNKFCDHLKLSSSTKDLGIQRNGSAAMPRSPNKILMTKKKGDKLYYLVDWKKENNEKYQVPTEFLSSELAAKYPQLIIDYLESRIKFAN